MINYRMKAVIILIEEQKTVLLLYTTNLMDMDLSAINDQTITECQYDNKIKF